MLATVINAVILRDAFQQQGKPCRLYTARDIETVGEVFDASQACADLEAGMVVICAG